MIKEVLIFVAGAGVGAAAAAWYLKKLYSDKSEKEIQSVKAAFEDELKRTRIELELAKKVKEEQDQPTEVVICEHPYAITSEEYHRNERGYFQEMLFYYSDDIVANINDEQINVDDTIGREALHILDEGMGDVLYIRNEKMETEWEINNDPRTYKEVTESWSDDSDGESD